VLDRRSTKKHLTLVCAPRPILTGMSNHCCAAPADTDTNVAACPASGTKGAPVELQTVKALLTEAALSRLHVGEYRFCPEPTCAVVYFDARRTMTRLRLHPTPSQDGHSLHGYAGHAV
jgi:predicted RNA-binding Zn ribbon-like protein